MWSTALLQNDKKHHKSSQLLTYAISFNPSKACSKKKKLFYLVKSQKCIIFSILMTSLFNCTIGRCSVKCVIDYVIIKWHYINNKHKRFIVLKSKYTIAWSPYEPKAQTLSVNSLDQLLNCPRYLIFWLDSLT